MLSEKFQYIKAFDGFCLEVSVDSILQTGRQHSHSDTQTGDRVENSLIKEMKLKEIYLDKKKFSKYFKFYLETLEVKLRQLDKLHRIKHLKKGHSEFFNHIMRNWDEVQLLTGRSENKSAGFAYTFMKDSEIGCSTFYFIAEGLEMHKK